MISSSQSVTSFANAAALPGQVSPSASVANSSPTDPGLSVSLRLSGGLPAAPTLNATGPLGVAANQARLDLAEQLPDLIADARMQSSRSLLASQETTLPASAATGDDRIVNTPPATSAAPATATVASAASATTTATSAAPLAIASTAANASAVVTLANPNLFVDPAVRALADFVANPVYGGIATALYINAANYRTQQASSAAVVNASDLPPPVTAASEVNVDNAEGNQESAEHWHGQAYRLRSERRS